MRIGLISDTHGLLRPEALHLQGCDHIVHAGDIGAPQVLAALDDIAPLSAIRGNVDTGEWAAALPDTRELTLAGIRLLVLHDLKTLDTHPRNQHYILAAGPATRTSRWPRSVVACSTSIPAAPGVGASACRSPLASCRSQATCLRRASCT